MKKVLLSCSLGVSALLMVGCAGYQLGPTAGQVAGGSSIEVQHFKNLTLEPRLSQYLMSPLRRSIQQDGTYRLSTEEGSSEYILSGTITGFRRDGIGSLPNEVVVHVDEYITIDVTVNVTERATGKVILEQDFSGSTIFQMGPDQTDSERQNIPAAMENLARNIVSIIADGKIKD